MSWGNIGVGILPIATDTGKWLVQLRSCHVNQPGTWGIMSGKVDDEIAMDLQAEAQRELDEETCYRGPLKLHKAYVFQTLKQKFTFHNFIGEIVKGDWEPCANWETERFEWRVYEELMLLEPKHFGLKLLLRYSSDLIRELSEKYKIAP